MARRSLLRRLKQIEKELEKTSSKYREKKSDQKIHTFQVYEDVIIKESIVQLKKLTGWDDKKVTEEFQEIFDAKLPEMMEAYKTAVNARLSSEQGNTTFYNLVEVSPGKSFRVTVASRGNKSANVFGVIRNIKQEAQRPFVQAIQAKINVLNQERPEGKKITDAYRDEGGVSFLDIGHEKTSAVSKQRKYIAENEIIKWMTKTSPEAKELLQSILDGIDWKIQKRDGEGVDELVIGFESSTGNKSSAKKEKEESAEFEIQLKKLIEMSMKKSGAWPAELEGSDSRVTKTRKKVLNSFTKKKFKNKRVTSNIKEEKIKKSSPEPITFPIATKASLARGAEKINSGGHKVRPDRKRRSTQNLFSLMTLINQKLPEQVRRNMGSPRLENVSGRFASSVKLTSVTTTRRGFPSFGYTYRKDPYQVYEDGAMGRPPWADSHRDPRQLIDTSIREIAAEMAIGRFYTRRE